MNEIAIFTGGVTLGAYLIDWLKNREIKKLEKELEDVRREAHKIEVELDELKRAQAFWFITLQPMLANRFNVC